MAGTTMAGNHERRGTTNGGDPRMVGEGHRGPCELLKFVDVHKQFGRKVVLAGATVTAASSEIVVIAGQNGSGKSTLLRLACGILEPTSGQIQIGGFSMRRQPQRAKALLGYVPDGLEAMPDLLASEFIALVRTLKPAPNGKPAPLDERWKDRLGVSAFWDQRLLALSFGQRKRVALLAALCGDPPLLLIDEPTNGLDAQGVELIHTLLEQRRTAGAVTLLSTNDIPFASALHATYYHLSGGNLIQVPNLGQPGESPDTNPDQSP